MSFQRRVCEAIAQRNWLRKHSTLDREACVEIAIQDWLEALPGMLTETILRQAWKTIGSRTIAMPASIHRSGVARCVTKRRFNPFCFEQESG